MKQKTSDIFNNMCRTINAISNSSSDARFTGPLDLDFSLYSFLPIGCSVGDKQVEANEADVEDF